ncbi:GNAT family N-acetyltransferase [Hanstruepera marina]|uniref:GNAT family N-acetyltransferase n=1 Tax=Hanstruepera marina TaxID=2873265 RepID=UPI0021032873|nr:GNAT family N-acetyltransferase [Hanstruepera marina]
MNIIAESDRIYLREFILDDAVHFYTMNSDNAVIQYTGDKAFETLEEATEFLKNYNQYKLFGMGRWAVCLKADDSFLGWCGLKYHPDDKLVEVGYRFYKSNWNKGYATESAKLTIEYGFHILKLKEIFAHAHEANLASHRVIEKCGLTFIEKGTYDNMPAKLYKINNPYYIIKQITALETYPVRHPILRKGRPIEDCAFELDNEETTFHLGLFFKNNLVGVASFIKNNNKLFHETTQYQLRGMAVLTAYQKKGLGNLLIEAGEDMLLKHCSRLWLNARQIALGFYKNKGYKIIGEPFEIINIGTHYTMTKELF